MPGFDGVETLRRIREINNGAYEDLPVVALTANTISGAREMFRNEGFTEFIPKPIERAVLERVLRRILPKHCIQYNAEPVAESGLTEETEKAVSLESVNPVEEIPEEETSFTTDATEGNPEEKAADMAEDSPAQDADAQEGEGGQSYEPLVQAGINVKMGLDFCCGEEDRKSVV